MYYKLGIRMVESNNLRNYKLGITKSRELDEILTYVITSLIALIGCFNFNLSIKIPILVILSAYCFITKIRINAINTDNKFLDEEIIQFRELAQELTTIKTINNKKLQQVSSIIVALHRTVNNLSGCLINKNNSFNEVKQALKDAFKDINKILYKFYADYQEHLTIALYYLCPQTNEYMDFISYKLDKTNKGRIWNLDDSSHICQAVRQIKLDPNIRDFVYDNIHEELPPVKNSRENDESEYVSSISIPILRQGDEIKAVLSITSNYPNRFRNAKSVDFQEVHINRIFVDLFYAISQIIEVVLKNNITVIEQNIIKDILSDYKKSDNDKLEEKHFKLLDDLTSNSSEVAQ